MRTGRSSRGAGNRSGAKGAVALSFDRKRDTAPVVVAKGSGAVAERIVQQAENHDVTVVINPSVLEALRIVPTGQPIPPRTYTAVAEILAFVARLNQRKAADAPVQEITNARNA